MGEGAVSLCPPAWTSEGVQEKQCPDILFIKIAASWLPHLLHRLVPLLSSPACVLVTSTFPVKNLQRVLRETPSVTVPQDVFAVHLGWGGRYDLSSLFLFT